jgi:hypothetical protein
MFEPENNEITAQSFEKALPHLPSCDCLIVDRMCKASKMLKAREAFSNIKYYSSTKLHGRKHVKQCPCNPHHKVSLKRRLRGVNTMVAEQTFSWFRGFARTFNEMRA